MRAYDLVRNGLMTLLVIQSIVTVIVGIVLIALMPNAYDPDLVYPYHRNNRTICLVGALTLFLVILPFHFLYLFASYGHRQGALCILAGVQVVVSLGTAFFSSPVLWLTIIQSSMVKEGAHLATFRGGFPLGISNDMRV